MRILLFIVIVFVLLGCGKPVPKVEFEGDTKVGSAVTLMYEGPKVSEVRSTFTDYYLDIIFISPAGEEITVPGYFAADGDSAHTAASKGKIWKTHFVPHSEGTWEYNGFFLERENIVFKWFGPHSPNKPKLTEFKGEFTVEEAQFDPAATDFREKGMLQDVGARYLQFSGTKDFFLKTGAGSPENILAYADFDGTYDVGGTNFPALGDNQLHEFEPHLKDAREGDPTWGDTKGAAILGIANYYEEVGVNAQYLVTMNVEGDGQGVFPWASHDGPYVFDVSQLAQWQRVFEHFNARGVLIDMLLTETENESWFEAHDGVEVGKDFADSRKLYYREMVARFGHLNGLVFNLGEENGVVGNSGQDPFRQPTSAEQRRAFAKYIRELDPYGHAVVSHNWPDLEGETYGALLGDPDFSGISLQAHDNYFEKIATWTQKSKAAGRQWMVTVDEPLGWEFGARPDSEDPDHEREIKEVLWPTLMAGGAGVNWYFGWQNNAPTSDLSNEDQRSRHNLWVKSAEVRQWWEENIPFWEMHANDEKQLQFRVLSTGGNAAAPHYKSLKQFREGGYNNPWPETITYQINGDDYGKERRLEIDPMNPK